MNAVATAANPHEIARQLDLTALGQAYDGEALRAAKNFKCLNDSEQAVLDRYIAGGQGGTDHVGLQDVAIRIRQAD